MKGAGEMREVMPSGDPDGCEEEVLLDMRNIHSFQTSWIKYVAIVCPLQVMSLKTRNNTVHFTDGDLFVTFVNKCLGLVIVRLIGFALQMFVVWSVTMETVHITNGPNLPVFTFTLKELYLTNKQGHSNFK